MKHLKSLILLAFVLAFSLGNTDCKKSKPQGPTVPSSGLPLSKFCGQLRDHRVSKAGVKVSACDVTMPDRYLEIAEDACLSRMATIRRVFPAWDASPTQCDILLVKPDGVLMTIPDYPRPYLNVGGINSAGTVLMGEARSIVVLPYYSAIGWSNEHYMFWSDRNEEEHASGFRNRARAPANHWRNFLGPYDRHPQEPPLDSELPDYARAPAGLAETDLSAGLDTLAPVELPKQTAEQFFDWLESEQKRLNKERLKQ